jgi:hypothetical protein
MCQATIRSRRFREITDAVEKYWSDYSIGISRGAHVVITLRLGPHARKVFTSASPSDVRTMLNFERDVRHEIAHLKTLAEKPIAKAS